MESFLMPYSLSNSGKEKLQFTPFWVGPKPVCSDGLRAGTIESHNFFCLRSYPGEISHSNSPNRELSNDLSDVVVRRRKVALHTISHLTPTEAWRSPDSTTWEGGSVSSEVRLGNCTQVWGVRQIWRAWDSRLRKNSPSHLFWLVQTCPDLRTIQLPCTLVSRCHFCTFECSYSSVLRPILVKLHILTRLIDSFPMLNGSWSCIEIEMLIPLAHA